MEKEMIRPTGPGEWEVKTWAMCQDLKGEHRM